MKPKIINETTVNDTFFAPVSEALARASSTRHCSNYSDEQHVHSGIMRVIENAASGRDWVQRLCMKFDKLNLSVRNFFSSLSSPRREDLVKEVSTDVREQTDRLLSGQSDDPLSAHPELKGFAVYASDGHAHKASAHEPEIKGKKRAVTHIYACNLRSHSLTHVSLLNADMTKKKEHEMNALKKTRRQSLTHERA